MGDRAVVTFHTNKNDYSPAVYLHWAGIKIPDLLQRAATRMKKGDPNYSAARFCGVCHENMDGRTGLGLLEAPNPGETPLEEYCGIDKYGHGDAGVFFVNVDTGEVRQFGGYDMTLPEPLELTT